MYKREFESPAEVKAFVDSQHDPEDFRKVFVRLWYWRNGGTSFTCHLFDLFQKADPHNFAKLAAGYPYEAFAFRQWTIFDESDLFNKFGLVERGDGA